MLSTKQGGVKDKEQGLAGEEAQRVQTGAEFWQEEGEWGMRKPKDKAASGMSLEELCGAEEVWGRPCGSGQMVPTGYDKKLAFTHSPSKKTSHLNSNQSPN